MSPEYKAQGVVCFREQGAEEKKVLRLWVRVVI